ncbi:MAG TPA: MBL fold metallo-hydrolase [Candidatus Binatia bacterium]|nr:MBL fold metallo-hydrolase [Candidatus Binatia bacterium]
MPPRDPPVHDAVTAVLTHGADVYITRRQPYLAAFPGYWAFPGGKVDATDLDTPLDADLRAGFLGAQPPRLLRALARELSEEIGLDLFAAVRAGQVRSLALLGEVTTPAFAQLRYRTWCYRVDFRERPALTLHPAEASHEEWAPAGLLRERFERGSLLVAPPTRAIIERLAAHPDADTVPGLVLPQVFESVVPWTEPLAGLRILLVRSQTLPPADRTNAFLIGDPGARRVLVDPSPIDDAELERLAAVAEELGGVDEIFLTHHHPDHRDRADVLARRWRVPLGMSADTHQRIAQKTGGRFFEGVETRTYREGDRLTEWLGEPVLLHEVPGHDEGQLAPMPRCRQWCVVGDLIQGIGTVVIAAPEGHMGKYFRSLGRVIADDPAVIVPSHGLALGGTHYLKQTLAHRRAREQQVRALHAAGKSPAEMVPAIYPRLDPLLLPLARMNVDSHLQKLREEGAIG